MTKEIKMYEAKDGTIFKTKQGANNHDKKIAVESVLVDLKMTKKEVSDELLKVAERNRIINMLLKSEPDWTKWLVHHILCINKKLLEKPQKKTEYVREYRDWGKIKEDLLFTELSDGLADPELHCADEWIVAKVEDANEFNRKVYYAYKYSWEERMLKKLNAGESLSEDEIKSLVNELDVAYEEEGGDRRWSKSMLSVVDLLDNLFAIQWEKGLTENQDNSYYEQPYPVELKKEERIIKTIVTTIIARDIINN